MHGHVGFLRPARRRAVDGHSGARARTRRHVLGYVRRLRAVAQRGAGRQSDSRASRQIRNRDQVRNRAHAFRADPARNQRHAPSTCAPPATPVSSASVSTRSISTISIASIPTRRSKTPSARWRRSLMQVKSVTSACRKRHPRRFDARARSIRSPRSRMNTRCGAASPKTERSRLAASWASEWSRTARSAAGF